MIYNPEQLKLDPPEFGLLSEITLRDLFAAVALSGPMAATTWKGDPSTVAKRVYEFADAMLSERDQQKP